MQTIPKPSVPSRFSDLECYRDMSDVVDRCAHHPVQRATQVVAYEILKAGFGNHFVGSGRPR